MHEERATQYAKAFYALAQEQRIALSTRDDPYRGLRHVSPYDPVGMNPYGHAPEYNVEDVNAPDDVPPLPVEITKP